MPWNSVWPDGTRSVKANETPGTENTAFIETTLQVDHYFDESAPNDGKHKQVHLPTIAAPTTAAGEGALYSKVVNSNNQAFWRFASSGTELQVTNNTISGPTSASANRHRGAFPLMHNLTMQFGIENIAAGNSTSVITFPVAYTTTCYCVVLTGHSAASPTNSVFVVQDSITVAGFIVRNVSSSITRISWMAIGR